MKIECTAEEKKKILAMMDSDEACILTDVQCCDVNLPCKRCMEEHIDWVITDEGGDGENEDT